MIKLKRLGQNTAPPEDEGDDLLFNATMSSETAARGVPMTPGGQRRPAKTEATPVVDKDLPKPDDIVNTVSEEANKVVSAEAAVAKDEKTVADGVPDESKPDLAKISARAIIGMLIDHGPAKYNFDNKASASYFVKYRDASGAVKVTWGIDLARAIGESKVKVGDTVALENLGKQLVKVHVPQFDEAGKVAGYEDKEVERNTWKVERTDVSSASASPATAKKSGRKAEAEATTADVKADSDDLTKAVLASVGARQAAPEGQGAPEATGGQRGAGSSVQGSSSAAQSVGELAGGLIGGALSVPFIALTSASRHLKQRFAQMAEPKVVPGQALNEGPGPDSFSFVNTMEKITDWKCERIEKMAEQAKASMADLKNTEGFPVWEEAVLDRASALGVSPDTIVKKMNSEPELADLKDKMTALWEQHPDKVAKVRDACNEYERNILNVVKEFANSDDRIKSRVTKTMKDVEKEGAIMPTFTDKIGEFGPSVAERMRLLAERIAEFVRGLLAKLTGKSNSPELSP